MNNLLKMSAIVLAMSVTAQAASADEKLVLYNWFEYMPQELLNKFTDETGIEVTLESYDSNESMLATLKAGGIDDVENFQWLENPRSFFPMVGNAGGAIVLWFVAIVKVFGGVIL